MRKRIKLLCIAICTVLMLELPGASMLIAADTDISAKVEGVTPATVAAASDFQQARVPVDLDGQVSVSSSEIYSGVTSTEYYLSEGSKFGENGPQYLRVLEFDPKQPDLAFDVVMAGDHVGDKATVSNIVDNFNKTNKENKTTVAAVNGDLWMMAQYHSRVEGSGTNFGGYSDAVVKKELCVPRGYVVSDGEIICSQNMQQETPFEEPFQSFGIADDGTPYLGNVQTYLSITDLSNGSKLATTLGLNRLPANNAIVIYSDKGPLSNYALDDAYEVVVDCDYDYRVFHGETITGTVTAISEPGTQRYPMKENRLIITARGGIASRIKGLKVGGKVSIGVKVTDQFGNTEAWQNIKEAVGGHVPTIRDGVDVNKGNVRYDPMTLIGYKADGTVVMIVNDGRQPGYSMGINRAMFDELCLDLGLDTAFLLDGGGSTTLVELAEDGYELKNRPSDGFIDAGINIEREVVNAVILSYVSEKTLVTGDSNSDGKVDMTDVTAMKRAFVGKLTLDESGIEASDVNHDGKLNLIDILMVKRYIAGKLVW